MTNCRPGDLARIVGPRLYGHLVEVLYATPAHRFALPDGHWHAGRSRQGLWVVRLLGKPIEVRLDGGDTRLAQYASMPDSALRPIRDPGEDAKDEMLRPLPEEVSA